MRLSELSELAHELEDALALRIRIAPRSSGRGCLSRRRHVHRMLAAYRRKGKLPSCRAADAR